jgi:hypothetical protein
MTPEHLPGSDFDLDIRVVEQTPAAASDRPYTVLRCLTPWCPRTMWKCPPSRQIPCRG